MAWPRLTPRATSNEPRKAAEIVSVDGGCDSIKDVDAGTQYAKSGEKVAGYTDTGVTLIAAKVLAGVDRNDVKTCTDRCWGKWSLRGRRPAARANLGAVVLAVRVYGSAPRTNLDPLAAALAEPVGVLGEPTAAPGLKEGNMVRALPHRVRGKGLPVVLISHNMPHVLEIADRIHVARLGRRAAVLKPKKTSLCDTVAVMTGAMAPADIPVECLV